MATSILYDKVLSPFYDVLAARLFPDFVHPNVITLMGGGCASLALIAIRAEAYGYAAALFICYSSLDNMDGKHARRTNQCSLPLPPDYLPKILLEHRKRLTDLYLTSRAVVPLGRTRTR